jgi:hypothetical protein
MADGFPAELTLQDLLPMLYVVAEALPGENQVETLANLSGLSSARLPSGRASPPERWTPVFEAALDAPVETFALLVVNIRQSLGAQSTTKLNEALRRVGLSCVSRHTRAAHPGLGDQADALLRAKTAPEISAAATQLRLTALGVRGLLMRPLLTENVLAIAPTVMDPEQRRMELADLAVDVVTALDYLLGLLGAPAATSPGLVLDTESGLNRRDGPSDADALDRLQRRRLDARGVAVRLGMRLLAGLRSDVASI